MEHFWKYIDQIETKVTSVTTMEQFCMYDDQIWIFNEVALFLKKDDLHKIIIRCVMHKQLRNQVVVVICSTF